MLLMVIFNAVLAVMIVSVVVALHTRAILTERVHHDAQNRRRHRPVRRPASTRPSGQPVPSAG